MKKNILLILFISTFSFAQQNGYWDNQKATSKEVSLSDIGLHTGKKVNLTFCPVKENYGIKFQRTDLEGQPIIEADVDYVTDIQRGTTLTKNGNSVSRSELVGFNLQGEKVEKVPSIFSIENNCKKVEIDDFISSSIN